MWTGDGLISFDLIYNYQKIALQLMGLMLHWQRLMMGIQSKTKEGILGTFAGHQTFGNIIVFALLKDRTEGKEVFSSKTSLNVRRKETIQMCIS